MQNQSLLLDEIFMNPSNQCLEDRFNPEKVTSPARCNGKCTSPEGCRAFVDTDVE